MKRWLILAATVLVGALLGWMPFRGTDVADLQPIEAVRIHSDHGTVSVQTDTGDSGTGDDLDAAFIDLKKTTAGEVFLETADYLIINEAAIEELEALCSYLRPGCGVCIEYGNVKLEDAVIFLKTHEQTVSLQDYRAGERTIPRLQIVEGRMHLVS